MVGRISPSSFIAKRVTGFVAFLAVAVLVSVFGPRPCSAACGDDPDVPCVAFHSAATLSPTAVIDGSYRLYINGLTVPDDVAAPAGDSCAYPALALQAALLKDSGNVPDFANVYWDEGTPGGVLQAFQVSTRSATSSVAGDNARHRASIWYLTEQVPSGSGLTPGSGRVILQLPFGETATDVIATVIVACGVDQDGPDGGGGVSSSSDAATNVAGTSYESATNGLVIDALAVEGNVVPSFRTPSIRDRSWDQATGSTANDLRGVRSNWENGSNDYVTDRYTLDINDHPALNVMTLLPEAPTAVALDRVTAVAAQEGVTVRWHAGWEADNLGYRVWRTRGGVERVVSDLIAGSFLSGSGVPLQAGYSYGWFDPEGREGDVYRIEALDTQGRARHHAPVVAAAGEVSSAVKKAFRSSSLAEINKRALEGGAKTSVVHSAVREGSGRQGPGGLSAARLASHWRVLGETSAALTVDQPGWYRVGYDALAADGLFAEPIASRKLRLLAAGVEVAISVGDGGDGVFGPGDALEFFGAPNDTPWSGTRTYWLTVSSGSGRRIHSRGGSVAASAETTVIDEAWVRERLFYVPAILNGDEDNMLGQAIVTDPVSMVLPAAAVDATSAMQATLTADLYLFTADQHRVAVKLNGVDVGFIEGQGEGRTRAEISIDPAILQESNSVVFENELETVSAVHSVELAYPRRTRAVDDQAFLVLPAELGTFDLRIAGFESDDVRVFDITDVVSPVQLSVSVVPDGQEHAIDVRVPSHGMGRDRLLLAVAGDAVSEPDVRVRPAIEWHAADNGADAVYVVPAAFASGLEPLVQWREEHGLTVAVVPLKDVMDEFGFGSKTPYALRDFLTRARSSWNVPPSSVVLVGDASYDSRDFLGFGLDVVPTKLVDTSTFETASDDWFVDVDGDGVGEVSIGRLPVTSAGETAAIAEKIVRFESGSAVGRSLMVADAATVGEDFSAVNDDLAAELPVGSEVDRIDVDDLAGGAHAALLNAIDAGTDLVHYSGHGNVNRWRGGLLTTDDVETMANADSPAVFTMLNCLSGLFQEPLVAGLGEVLLRADGGAAAVWASTGSTNMWSQRQLMKAFFAAATGDEAIAIGDAARHAKMQIESRDIRLTWVLLGDPLTMVR